VREERPHREERPQRAERPERSRDRGGRGERDREDRGRDRGDRVNDCVVGFGSDTPAFLMRAPPPRGDDD
jgi:hypothetical protein